MQYLAPPPAKVTPPRSLERHADLAVVRLLDQTPQRRTQRLAQLREHRESRREELKRTRWQALVDARRELEAARTVERVPEISRWRADAIEEAHRAVLDAEERLAGKRLGRRAARDLAAAEEREQELLTLAGCATYESFRAKVATGSEDERRERIERAQRALDESQAAWDRFEGGTDPELVALDEEIAALSDPAHN